MALHCLSVDPAVAIARGVFGWLEAGDAVLLLGPAVTLAQDGHAQLPAWLAHDVTLHALMGELALHGVDAVDPRVQVTDYAGWVELVVEHPQQMTWD
jgi:sulfur relay protein TusB/DsrH